MLKIKKKGKIKHFAITVQNFFELVNPVVFSEAFNACYKNILHVYYTSRSKQLKALYDIMKPHPISEVVLCKEASTMSAMSQISHFTLLAREDFIH